MNATSEKSVAMYGVVPASKIIGESVVNRQDENVGKIHELVIDAKKESRGLRGALLRRLHGHG